MCPQLRNDYAAAFSYIFIQHVIYRARSNAYNRFRITVCPIKQVEMKVKHVSCDIQPHHGGWALDFR